MQSTTTVLSDSVQRQRAESWCVGDGSLDFIEFARMLTGAMQKPELGDALRAQIAEFQVKSSSQSRLVEVAVCPTGHIFCIRLSLEGNVHPGPVTRRSAADG